MSKQFELWRKKLEAKGLTLVLSQKHGDCRLYTTVTAHGKQPYNSIIVIDHGEDGFITYLPSLWHEIDQEVAQLTQPIT